MSLIRSSVSIAAAALLFGCGEAAPVNPPTEPARPIQSETALPQGTPGTLTLPGRGPASFVGRWAADVSLCASPQGERRPIEITPTRFEGYENSCAIATIDEVVDGYVATLDCQSQDRTRRERVKMSVATDTMTLLWLDRTGPAVTLRQCTTLGYTSTTAPVLPVG